MKFLISILFILTIAVPRPTATQTVSPLVTFPSPQVEFIIGPQVRVGTEPIAAYYDEIAMKRGKYWAEQFLALTTIFNESNQYDLPYCLYILYYRTGDVVYRDYARRVADKWWKSEYLLQGGPVGGGSIPNPRQVGLLGLTLWAMDVNPPNVWGYLDRITREWMDVRLLAKLSNPDIYTDPREEGSILLAAIVLSQRLPDAYPQIVWDNQLVVSTKQVTDGAARRAAYLADAERVAVEYFGRLQYLDGSWRWRMWNPEPQLQQKIDQYRATLGDKMEQPFMVGIYMEAATRLHQITQNATVKASLQSQIVKHCDHLMRDAYIVNQTGGVTSIPRVLLYFYPREFIFDPTASDRHLTTSVIHTFGYAYKITGDRKYLTQGDELWDSCFAVQPKDGFRSLLDEPYWLKLFTAETRSSGSYLAWRLGGGTTTPLPTPTPAASPTPSPTPSPVPSPSPTPVPTPIPTVRISGIVTMNSVPSGGVTVRLLNAVNRVGIMETQTNSDGAYSFSVTSGSSVVVVPVSTGATFNPTETLLSPLTINTTANFALNGGLPVCRSNQFIGVPPQCRCVAGIKGGSGKCR